MNESGGGITVCHQCHCSFPNTVCTRKVIVPPSVASTVYEKKKSLRRPVMPVPLHMAFPKSLRVLLWGRTAHHFHHFLLGREASGRQTRSVGLAGTSRALNLPDDGDPHDRASATTGVPSRAVDRAADILARVEMEVTRRKVLLLGR